MTHFNALDFSECCFEEVVSKFLMDTRYIYSNLKIKSDIVNELHYLHNVCHMYIHVHVYKPLSVL